MDVRIKNYEGKPHLSSGHEDAQSEFCMCTFEGPCSTGGMDLLDFRLANANQIRGARESLMTTEYAHPLKSKGWNRALDLTLKGDDIELYNNCFHTGLMCSDCLQLCMMPSSWPVNWSSKQFRVGLQELVKAIRGNGKTTKETTTITTTTTITATETTQYTRNKTGDRKCQGICCCPDGGRRFMLEIYQNATVQLTSHGRVLKNVPECQRIGSQEKDCRVRLQGEVMTSAVCYLFGVGEKGIFKDQCLKSREPAVDGARMESLRSDCKNPRAESNVVTGTFCLMITTLDILFWCLAAEKRVFVLFCRLQPLLILAPTLSILVELIAKVELSRTGKESESSTESGDKQDEAFQILKEKLCNAPVLALPDGPDDFVVYCDASKQGFGSVLMQRGKSSVLGLVALNRLKLSQELSCVHDTFHVSNLKKCLAEPDVQVPLDEIEIDENLRFVEEPIEIIERDVKKLKRRRIPLVKVRWNSRSLLEGVSDEQGLYGFGVQDYKETIWPTCKEVRVSKFKNHLSDNEESLGEDASKQGRINDEDAKVTFIDETSNDARNKNNKISNSN
ncbi:putative reverse transcriptase domain-containing protein [Tanacetum coccineum]